VVCVWDARGGPTAGVTEDMQRYGVEAVYEGTETADTYIEKQVNDLLFNVKPKPSVRTCPLSGSLASRAQWSTRAEVARAQVLVHARHPWGSSIPVTQKRGGRLANTPLRRLEQGDTRSESPNDALGSR